MSSENTTRLHASVAGHVQGVGFRFFVVDEAQALGLNGWVRNCWDDTVEVVAEGPRPTLEKLLVSLRRGPAHAHVTQVNVDWQTGLGNIHGFDIRPTE
jgi:acylphosphatase